MSNPGNLTIHTIQLSWPPFEPLKSDASAGFLSPHLVVNVPDNVNNIAWALGEVKRFREKVCAYWTDPRLGMAEKRHLVFVFRNFRASPQWIDTDSRLCYTQFR